MGHSATRKSQAPSLGACPANILAMLELSTPVQYVKGIGPRLAQVLDANGLRAGEMATVIAEVRNSGLFRTRRMPIFQMTAGQGRAKLKCIWFNAGYLRDKFKPGQVVALYGKVEADKRSGELQIIQPQFEVLEEPSENGTPDSAEKKLAESLEIGRIVPIYEAIGRLTSRWFRRVIHTALERLTPDMPDSIPEMVRRRLSLISPLEALRRVHWPEAGESVEDL